VVYTETSLPVVLGVNNWDIVRMLVDIQDESLARGPKLLSIKNYVIEIIT